MAAARRPIAVYDSGVGGISVLASLRRLMPWEDYCYFGDNGNAPYGTKTQGQVEAFAFAAWERLARRDPKLLVVACNTATSAAGPALRDKLRLPVVGMEPALKPAQSLHREGIILVMATPMTLALPKFEALMARYGQGAVPLPSGGLMEFAEQGRMESATLDHYLEALFAPYLEKAIDAVVLGCTHYLFLREAIRRHLPPGTPIIDGNHGTAQRAKALLEASCMLSPPGTVGTVCFETSGQPERVLPLMKRLYEQAVKEEL